MRLINWLDAPPQRRRWGRWKGTRNVIAYTIWLVKLRIPHWLGRL